MKSSMLYIQLIITLILLCSITSTTKFQKTNNSNTLQKTSTTSETTAITTTNSFVRAIANPLFANKNAIDNCIDNNWKGRNSNLDSNNDFNEMKTHLKNMMNELNNYKKFFKAKVNYECHYSGVAKGNIINRLVKSAHRRRVFVETGNKGFAGDLARRAGNYIKKIAKKVFCKLGITTNCIKSTPTNQKTDSSDGKILTFLANNFHNFKTNILDFTDTTFFRRLSSSLQCIKNDTQNGSDKSFKKVIGNLEKNLNNLKQHGLRAEIVMAVDCMCSWRTMKEVLSFINKGFSTHAHEWENFIQAISGLIKILSL